MSSNFQDLSDWVVQITNCEKPKDSNSIEWLRDGIILCTLLDKLQPGILEQSKINREKDSMPFGWIENIGLYLQTCKKIGLHPDDLFVTADLFQNRDPQLVFRNITAVAVWARNIPAVKTRMLSRNQTTQDRNSISPQKDDLKSLKRRSAGDIYLASSMPGFGNSMPNLMGYSEDDPTDRAGSSGRSRSPMDSPRPLPASVNTTDMDDLWDQIKNLKKKNMALEVDNESLSQDKEDLQKKLDEKEAEIQKHQSALGGTQESLAQFESVQKQLAETKVVNGTLASRVEELEVRLQKMEFERQNLAIERKILESEKQHVMNSPNVPMTGGLSKSISHDSSLNNMADSSNRKRSFTVGSMFMRRGSVKEPSPKPKKSGSPLSMMFSRKKSTS